METKTCNKCKTEKLKKQFSKSKIKSDGLNANCKECHKILRRKHYLRNKDKIKTQVKEFKVKYNKWAKSIKDGKECLDCKKKFPWYVLDFDHRNPNKKSFTISSAFQRHRSKKEVKKEIEKCDLVCSNCHRVRTYKRDWCSDNT